MCLKHALFFNDAARAPFASPYCPCHAQIRRVHVQPSACFAVSFFVRVEIPASHSSRAHHLTISQV
jgi:hypothetical protein